MTTEQELPRESAEDLFENAPCGYLSTAVDGTILKVNRTFESWSGFSRGELIGRRRFQDLLSAGGRIYYETHCAPLLHMQGAVREIAVDLVGADGSKLPALISSVIPRDDADRPRAIRTVVFEATDRRQYERELMDARRREREVAAELQASLLSGELPSSDQIDVGVGYRPGVSSLEVGGDWYDAFWLDDGETVALVVGDVVGRGIAAAATMGQLRSAVRALASTGLSPASLLGALDEFVRRHGVGSMATLVYAELRLASGSLRFACAGHPPPLIVPREGGARFAWGGRSAPLDAYGEVPRGDGSEQLGAGGLVVLYTDGLVERRSAPLDEGMERLRAQLAIRRDEPSGAIAKRVLHLLSEGSHADDVCMLVARTGKFSGTPGP